jgi:hypothetical protein
VIVIVVVLPGGSLYSPEGYMADGPACTYMADSYA